MTEAHRDLQRRTAAWASRQWPEVRLECRIPRSPFRADVVAAARGTAPVVQVFECKVSVPDWRRDDADETATAQELRRVQARLSALHQALSAHRPEWCSAPGWLPGLAPPALPPGFRHSAHAGLSRRQSQLRRRLAEGTKFSRLVRYRAASALWLVTAPPLPAPPISPWGWLELQAGDLHLRRAAVPLQPPPATLRAWHRLLWPVDDHLPGWSSLANLAVSRQVRA